MKKNKTYKPTTNTKSPSNGKNEKIKISAGVSFCDVMKIHKTNNKLMWLSLNMFVREVFFCRLWRTSTSKTGTTVVCGRFDFFNETIAGTIKT